MILKMDWLTGSVDWKIDGPLSPPGDKGGKTEEEEEEEGADFACSEFPMILEMDWLAGSVTLIPLAFFL